MNIFKAYFLGLRKAAGLPRPVFVIYFVNILMALLIVFPLYRLLDAEIGNSLNIARLLQGFDWSVFSDFFKANQGAVQAILSQVKWILLIYWLLSVFFAGGIIRTLNESRFSMASFFHGAGYNFFRFLGISLIVLVLHIIVVFITYLPAFLIISNFGFKSELHIIVTLAVAMAIHLFLLIWLLAVNDYSKFYAVLHHKNSLNAFAGGFRYVIRNFGRAYFLYLFLLIVPALAIYGYFKIDAEIGTSTRNGVIAVFFVQQAFIVIRIWFRIWIYASPLKMFTRDFEKLKIRQEMNFENAIMTESDNKPTNHGQTPDK